MNISSGKKCQILKLINFSSESIRYENLYKMDISSEKWHQILESIIFFFQKDSVRFENFCRMNTSLDK